VEGLLLEEVARPPDKAALRGLVGHTWGMGPGRFWGG